MEEKAFQLFEKWGILAYIYFPPDEVDIFNLNNFFEQNYIPKEEARVISTVSKNFLTINMSANFLAISLTKCVPVFFYDPINRVVGLANANSKVLAGRVLSEAVKEMLSLGAKERDILVEIGPTIFQEAVGLREIISDHFKKTGIKMVCSMSMVNFSVSRGTTLAIIGMAGRLKNYKKV
jgi:hypothetical protein